MCARSGDTQLSMLVVCGTIGASSSSLTVSNRSLRRGGCSPLTERERQSILSVRDVMINAVLITTERGMVASLFLSLHFQNIAKSERKNCPRSLDLRNFILLVQTRIPHCPDFTLMF